MIYILIGYIWLFIHRPFEIWESLGTFRLELVYVLFAVTVWILSGRIRWSGNPLHLAYGAFALAMVMCWARAGGPVRRTSSWKTISDTLVFYVLLVTSVHDEKELKLITVGFIGAMFLYMAILTASSSADGTGIEWGSYE